MAAKDRSNDPKRKAGPWPTPIGMGALVGYGDFERAKELQDARQREEEAFDSGGMDAVNKLRAERDSD